MESKDLGLLQHFSSYISNLLKKHIMKQKHLLTALLASLIYMSSFAQPTIEAQKTIGGFFSDQLSSIYSTKDGGLIAGGTSESYASGEKTENSRGATDYWIVKLDKWGKIEWDKTIG